MMIEGLKRGQNLILVSSDDSQRGSFFILTEEANQISLSGENNA
ncbi:MAG: hypothetical protein ACE5GI_01150 [Candidatus Aminicenantales bacterium]